MQTIDVYSFNKLVIENNYEVFEQEQMISYINSIRKSVNDDLFKSLSDELKQKANDEYKSELESFKPYLVVERKKVGHDEKIVKSIKFVRDQQVIWDVDNETNEIMKAKAGTYTNTSLNRKLMRVGAKYGEGKKEETKPETKDTNSELRQKFVESYYKDEIENLKKRGNWSGYNIERVNKNYSRDLKSAKKGEIFHNFIFEEGFSNFKKNNRQNSKTKDTKPEPTKEDKRGKNENKKVELTFKDSVSYNKAVRSLLENGYNRPTSQKEGKGYFEADDNWRTISVKGTHEDGIKKLLSGLEHKTEYKDPIGYSIIDHGGYLD